MTRRATKINPGHALRLRLAPADLVRLLSRVTIDPTLTYRGTPCWLWQGWTDDHGYGRVSINGKNEWTHRAFRAAFRKAIPAGMEVDHRCRRPGCCNPDHTRVRTVAKNRSDTRRHWPKPAALAAAVDDIPF